jgi:hypothetical protein
LPETTQTDTQNIFLYRCIPPGKSRLWDMLQRLEQDDIAIARRPAHGGKMPFYDGRIGIWTIRYQLFFIFVILINDLYSFVLFIQKTFPWQ